MNCKNKKVDKWLGWLILGLGVISFLYGLLTFIIVQPEGKSANTLMGMFTGFGFGIMLVGLRTAIRNKRTPKDKLEQEEIERNDERNIAIARAAGTVSMIAGMTIFAVLAFVFMGSIAQNDLVWELMDMFNNLMVIPNAIALFCLGGMIVNSMKKSNKL